jgi:hypothetical protein
MNRHRSYWPLDENPTPFGDAVFTGVNALLDPALLAEGQMALAVNARFDHGRAATRRGIRIMPWGALGYQYQQLADPGMVLPYGQAIMGESFRDPFGVEWVLIITADGTYKTQPGGTGTPVPIPPGEASSLATDLIQSYNGMVMLRGRDAKPMYLRDVDEGWRLPPAPDAGKEEIPPSYQGVYFQNRLFLVDARDDPQHRDTVWVSDIGGVSSTLQGELAYQSFKINTGSSDRLRGIAKWNETTLVAGKDQSIYVVTNIYGSNQDLALNSILAEVTHAYGCIAPRTFCQVGKDLWFLGHRRGIVSLSQTETNAIQGVDVPVSRDIQPLIDRINWEHSEVARAEAHENGVYFAVPLDNAKDNTAVLVYSTLTKSWAGYDFSAATRVRDFLKYTYSGAVRLGFLSQDGFLCLYGDGYHDQVGDAAGLVTNVPIATVLRTRAYAGTTSGNKKFFRATARVATWNGSFTVHALPQGYNETFQLDDIDRDNRRYIRPHGAPPWSVDNGGDDWDTPWREDYSADMHHTSVTAAVTGVGTMGFDILQELEEIWNIPKFEGNHAQLEISSRRGRLELCGLVLDTTRGSTASGTHG